MCYLVCGICVLAFCNNKKKDMGVNRCHLTELNLLPAPSCHSLLRYPNKKKNKHNLRTRRGKVSFVYLKVRL